MNLAVPYSRRLSHPVDLIEEIAYGHNWSYERTAMDELAICVTGKCAEYDVSFSWMEDHEALHIACAFHVDIPAARHNEVQGLLVQINGRLLMGHFDYWMDSYTIIYRQALLLAGGLHPSDVQVELLLMNALEICEKHYKAFQMISWSGTSASQALQYTLFETIGNA